MAACVNGADDGAAQTEPRSVSTENHPERQETPPNSAAATIQDSSCPLRTNQPTISKQEVLWSLAVTNYIHASTFSDTYQTHPSVTWLTGDGGLAKS